MKPTVAFPLARDFNESVAIDLKFYCGKPILHLIDHATRYITASVVRSKDIDAIISRIFEIDGVNNINLQDGYQYEVWNTIIEEDKQCSRTFHTSDLCRIVRSK